jgi:uncharacterized lipoprotein YajG
MPRSIVLAVLSLLILAACATPAPPAGNTAPATPSGLSATPDDGQVLLSWNANTESDLKHYNLYQDTGGALQTAAFEKITEVLAGTESFLVTGLSNDQSYTFTLDAEDTKGTTSA